MTRTARPKPRKTNRAGYRFADDVAQILEKVATKTHRTKTSIIEQLLREYCTTKNLNP